jgi:prepilin-type N-terminal cleavage/methylation domain-containing protein
MKMFQKTARRSGFTLIELLVVIAIIAILAIVVILTLNPGQLIAQARDSNRISDIATIKSAIAYYQQDVANPTLGTPAICYEDGPTNSTNGTLSSSTCPWFLTAPTVVITTSSRSVSTSTGWIPINLSLISVGSPIGQWPADPLNTVSHAGGVVVTSTDHFYSYAASSTSAGGFKLGGMMESQKYSTGGSGDVETNDGGNNIFIYEQGSNITL